jgi:hypothetical protein
MEKVSVVVANLELAPPPVGHVVLHGRSPVKQRAVVAKVVVVAFVPVALMKVKFWRVVEARARKLVEKRLVAVSAVDDAYGRVEAVVLVEVIAPPTKRLLEM